MNNKDKIAETTFFLSLKYGFDNVSINQIREEGGVTTGAIYYHFNDKKDILEYMVKKYLFDQIKNFKLSLNNFEGPFFEKLKFMFYYHLGLDIENHEYITGISDNKVIYYKDYYSLFTSIYHQYPNLRHIYDELNRIVLDYYENLIREAINNDEIRNDIDCEKMSLFIFTILKGVIDVGITFSELSAENLIEDNLVMIEESLKKENI